MHERLAAVEEKPVEIKLASWRSCAAFCKRLHDIGIRLEGRCLANLGLGGAQGHGCSAFVSCCKMLRTLPRRTLEGLAAARLAGHECFAGSAVRQVATVEVLGRAGEALDAISTKTLTGIGQLPFPAEARIRFKSTGITVSHRMAADLKAELTSR